MVRTTPTSRALLGLAGALVLASCAAEDAPAADAFAAGRGAGADRWLTVDARRLARAVPRLSPDARAAFTPADVVDGVAIVRAPAGAIAELSAALHAGGARCGGFMAHPTRAAAIAAARAAAAPRAVAYAAAYTMDRADVVAAVTAGLSAAAIEDTIRTLSAYRNRFYTSDSGVDAAEWLADRWRAITAGRPDAQVRLVPHAFAQPSVELTIRGTAMPDEYVVIGGHLDSIAPGGANAVAPGADDNASGIAALTDVVRAMVAAGYRPDRTIVVYAYAGEEVGLLGSQDIAEDAAARGLNVVGALQLDMVNHHGSPEDMAIITDYTDPALTAFLEQLVDTYVGASRVRDTCGYACSDHASWYRAGFPVVHPFESRAADINAVLHTPDDTIDVSGGRADHALTFARTTAAFAVELAKGRTEDACTTDSDCGDGQTCAGGACVPMPPGGPDAGSAMPPGGPDAGAGGGAGGDGAGPAPVTSGCAAAGAPAADGGGWLALAWLAAWSARRRQRARAASAASARPSIR